MQKARICGLFALRFPPFGGAGRHSFGATRFLDIPIFSALYKGHRQGLLVLKGIRFFWQLMSEFPVC